VNAADLALATWADDHYYLLQRAIQLQYRTMRDFAGTATGALSGDYLRLADRWQWMDRYLFNIVGENQDTADWVAEHRENLAQALEQLALSYSQWGHSRRVIRADREEFLRLAREVAGE